MFGFNGKEVDNEAYGDGNSYDYGFRVYNPRLGRFLSVDPLAKSFAFYTPYQYAGNKPIVAVDVDGLEDFWTHYIPQNDGTVTERISDNEVASFLMRTWLFLSGKGTSNIPKSGAVVTQEEADGTISVKSYVPTAMVEATGTSLIGNLYGNTYGEFSGNSNPANEEALPGGPDYAGVGANVDASVVAGAGVQASVLETPQGTGSYITAKTIVGGVSFEAGPSFEMGWKTRAAKNDPTSSVIPGDGQYLRLDWGFR